MIANGLNKKEFRYLLLSYTRYGFGLVKGSKISDFWLTWGQDMTGRGVCAIALDFNYSFFRLAGIASINRC